MSSAPSPLAVGPACEGLLQYLIKQQVIPPGGAEVLRAESLAILSGCAPPVGATAKKTGLVCGYVQSGKTVSIETVAALAKDNGFRIMVLIAGVTTNLVDQSVGRMEHLRAGAGGYDWVMLTNPREDRRGQLESLVQEWRDREEVSGGCQTLFITVMKNVHHLRPVADLLMKGGLHGIPALIFDDEADQASLNTRPRDPRPSPIYKSIEELRAALPHHTLLQYTATPQAPLLISRIDSLSADFAELVSPGEGYAGGSVFFKQRPELIKTIPGKDIFEHTSPPKEPPQSLLEALQIFFMSVAARYVEGTLHGNRSMLVHPHQRKQMHETYLRWVEIVQASWVRTLTSANDPDRDELLQEFATAYQELGKTVSNLPPLASLETHLRTAIGRTVITLVNSENGHEILWGNGYAHILVGGEKLSRGYTVKGLTVTYMPRGPGGWTADTIQQRARFFGYHNKPEGGYLDYCRVYLDGQVRAAFTAYIEHEEDIRSQIKRSRGTALQSLKRAFFLDGQLRATRHNIMRQLYQRPNLGKGWFEQKVPHAAPYGGERNAKFVEALHDSLTLTADSTQRHEYADVNLKDILENFLILFSCPDDRDATPMCAIQLTLADEAARPDASPCRVVFVDRLDPDIRTRTERSGTIDLQQGRSSGRQADRYPGDRHLPVNVADRVTLQIHRLRVITTTQGGPGKGNVAKSASPIVPALAIYLPPRLVKDIIVQPNN